VEGRDDPKLNIVGLEGVPGLEDAGPAAPAPPVASSVPAAAMLHMMPLGFNGAVPPFLCVRDCVLLEVGCLLLSRGVAVPVRV
jgi:hypothetical protein